jgi:hypothetical protein
VPQPGHRRLNPLSSSSGIEDGTEQAEHLHRLLGDLEPVTAPL